MTEYVCGYLFFKKFVDFAMEDHVLLVLKNKPAKQAGKYNGIGGKVEGEEKAIDAMIREFREETTVETTAETWREIGSMVGPDFVVTFFKGHVANPPDFSSPTAEKIEAFPTSQLPANLLESNRYLLSMAIDNEVLDFTVIIK